MVINRDNMPATETVPKQASVLGNIFADDGTAPLTNNVILNDASNMIDIIAFDFNLYSGDVKAKVQGTKCDTARFVFILFSCFVFSNSANSAFLPHALCQRRHSTHCALC